MHKDEESIRKKYFAVVFPNIGGQDHIYCDLPYAKDFDPHRIIKKLRKSEFSPNNKFTQTAMKNLIAHGSLLKSDFAKENMSVDFDSYDDLLRSISIAKSLEEIPAMMLEV